MIAIIDYGVGNLFSLSSSLNYLGFENIVTNKAADLKAADKLILPGVGAFGDAKDKLDATRLVPVLDAQVSEGKPLLGICLGMQLLFEKSYEYGLHAGLGYIKGEVRSLKEDFEKRSITLKVPHMGWNALELANTACPLFNGTSSGDYVYFVHSYHVCCCKESLAATAFYGVDVTAAVAYRNIYGTQFHPEKSGKVGLNILKNFCELTGGGAQ